MLHPLLTSLYHIWLILHIYYIYHRYCIQLIYLPIYDLFGSNVIVGFWCVAKVGTTALFKYLVI